MTRILRVFSICFNLCSCKRNNSLINLSKNPCFAFILERSDNVLNFLGVNVVCGKNEMTISIRKTLLKGIDVEHIRLSDVNCRAIENPTGDRFILQTELTKCGTKVRHAKNFVIYKNKVEEIPLENGQIVTRVREVEIPFSCYYSNTGVVSAVGLEVTSKKIIFSRKGFGQFILEMNIFPNSDFVNNYRKEDFPVSVTLRERLFVKVSVDTDDEKLEIMAETCFATPDPDPKKLALKYMFIEDGYGLV